MDLTTKLPVENALFLFLSRFGVSEEELLSYLEQINRTHESVDINKIFDLALMNGTAGFVYRNVALSGIFPEPVVEYLRAWHSGCLARNTMLRQETERLLKVLSEQAIPVIPLKGAIASEILFADLGVYPSGDIDLLVRPADLARVKAVLCGQGGYAQPEEIREADLIAGHYHLMFAKDDLLCEVHWNCVKRYFDVSSAFWWEDAQEVVLADGTAVLQPTPEKYLLYLIFRLFDHCFYPLRFLTIISALLQAYADTISWERLMAYAARLRMKRLTVFVLCLLRQIQGLDIPPPITDQKIIGHNRLTEIVLSGIFRGARKPHLRMAVYTLLLDSPGAVLKILIGRMMPSAAELRLRYGLRAGSPWIFFFHLLNPFLLLLDRKKFSGKDADKP